MSASLAVLIGLVAGGGLGVIAGRDLTASVMELAASRGRAKAAWGLVRRLSILAAGLLGSLLIGPYAWAGLAAGYLGAFSVVVLREIKVHVG
ncbi:MAG: hypothetical protein AAB152_02995 [Candidatus Coatesbacteria bacterium]